MRLGPTIYLDYQASTPLDPGVLEVMEASWRSEFANPQASDHVLGWRAHQRIEAAAATIAGLVGVSGDHVVFTAGATEANWLAILGVGATTAKRRIAVSAVEHKSVRSAAEEAGRRFNLQVDTIGVAADGCVSAEALTASLSDDVALVSIMAVNNEIGSINDIARLAEACAGVGALLHVDASQAPQALDLIDVMNFADLLTLSSHKAYGPKGIGALVASPDLQGRMAALYPGGSGLRAGTLATPLCVGFAAAFERLIEVGPQERRSIAALRDRFVSALRARVEATLVGPPTQLRHPGNACVQFKGVEAGDLLSSLQPFVAASTQSACNTGAIEPSAVLLAIGLDSDSANSCVRFSFGRFSDEAQVDEAVDHLVKAIEARRAGLHRHAGAA